MWHGRGVCVHIEGCMRPVCCAPRGVRGQCSTQRIPVAAPAAPVDVKAGEGRGIVHAQAVADAPEVGVVEVHLGRGSSSRRQAGQGNHHSAPVWTSADASRGLCAALSPAAGSPSRQGSSLQTAAPPRCRARCGVPCHPAPRAAPRRASATNRRTPAGQLRPRRGPRRRPACRRNDSRAVSAASWLHVLAAWLPTRHTHLALALVKARALLGCLVRGALLDALGREGQLLGEHLQRAPNALVSGALERWPLPAAGPPTPSSHTHNPPPRIPSSSSGLVCTASLPPCGDSTALPCAGAAGGRAARFCAIAHQ